MKEILNLYKTKNTKKYSTFTKMFDKNHLYENAKKILPSSIYEKYCKDVKLDIEEIKKIDNYNYVAKFKENQKIFSHIEPAKIDGLTYLALKEIENNQTILSCLNSFKPYKGFALKANYLQTETITGRLISSKNSCKILTLPSKYRKIFKSSWDKEGKIFQVDFNNLEPRLIKKINKQECSIDIYQDVAEKLSFKIDRSVIKKAIISILYGQKKNIENISLERNKEIFLVVNDYFNLSLLKKFTDTSEFGCRYNFFGRPIWNGLETSENKIINNFIQSSAVDIALSYFSELTEVLDKDKVKFLFVIHDAVIIDVHQSYYDRFKEICSQGYTCLYLNNFPVKVEELN